MSDLEFVSRSQRVKHYPAKAVRLPEFRETSKGVPCVEVHFEILDGPLSGLTIRWLGFFGNELSAKRTIQSLAYAGFDVDRLFSTKKTRSSGRTEIAVGWAKNRGTKRPVTIFDAEMRNEFSPKTVFLSVVVDSYRPAKTEDDPRPKIVRRNTALFVNSNSDELRRPIRRQSQTKTKATRSGGCRHV